MGGRAAEELIFGPENVTSGASSDIQQATRLAKAMVTKYGLGEKVGIMFFDDKEKLGEESQEEIDKEVRQLLRDSYSRAKTLIESNSAQLDRIAQGLLEFESLSGIEVVDVMNGKKINAKIRSQRPSREIKQSLPLNPSAKPQKNS
jgi:ATP-dependent metalloprotease